MNENTFAEVTESTEETTSDAAAVPSYVGDSRITSGPLEGATLSTIGLMTSGVEGGGIQMFADAELDQLVKDLAAAKAALKALEELKKDRGVAGNSLRKKIENIANKINDRLSKRHGR